MEKDKIKGGYADKVKDSMFDSKQLKKGIKVEMEHTNSRAIAKEIAKDHLYENPNYYIELEKMELKLGNKRIIEFYNDGSFKYVDKRYLMKSKKGGFYVMVDRVVHYFNSNKDYINSERI